MSSPYELKPKVRTLTPIWTGGVEQTMHTKESGIVGSMRFWASRLFDENTVDALFGSTAQARSFRLHVEGLTAVPVKTRMQNIEACLSRVACRTIGQRTALWGDSNTGEFTLRCFFRYTDDDAVLHAEQLQQVLLFMERYTAIGAKTQHGFGQFSIDGGVNRSITIPSPECFDAATFQAKISGWRAIASPWLKSQILRALPELKDSERTGLFGGVIQSKGKDIRFGSRLHIGYPYQVGGRSVVKIWCFRERTEETPTAQMVVDAVRGVLRTDWTEVTHGRL